MLKSSTTSFIYLVAAFAILILNINCKKETETANSISKSNSNFITSITFENLESKVYIADSIIDISILTPVSSKRLKPIIDCSPRSTISPRVDSIFDFSLPQVFTVFAENGLAKRYTISVNVLPLIPFGIRDCRILGIPQKVEITMDKINIYVPHNSTLENVSLDITLSDLNITVSPRKETYNLTAPQDLLLTDSIGNTRMYKLTVYKSPWEQVVAHAPFLERDGSGFVEFKNYLWLLGGWTHHYGVTNEIWRSPDGQNWEMVLKNAPWSARHGAGTVKFKDKIWIISGDGYPDVWSSGDGINWTLEAETAPWGRRYAPYIAVFDDKIWLMGGISWYDENGHINVYSVKSFNDVWNSTDGKTWNKVIENAPWAGRGLIHGFATLGDELYIMGGGIKGGTNPNILESETIAEYNDIWKTKDGIIWELVKWSAPWSARTHFSVTSYDDKIWVSDGSQTFQSIKGNDVWYSSNGYDWKQVKHSFWTPRHASSFGTFNNRLWLIAGFGSNDVNVLDKSLVE